MTLNQFSRRDRGLVAASTPPNIGAAQRLARPARRWRRLLVDRRRGARAAHPPTSGGDRTIRTSVSLPSSEHRPAGDAGRAGVIVVVEDDASLCDALVGLLQSCGYDACGFSSGPAYLASGEAGSTRCLITDYQMPGLSGFDLVAAVKHRDPSIPVIMITARDEPELARRAQGLGVDRFLKKPFRDNQLVAAVAACVGEDG